MSAIVLIYVNWFQITYTKPDIHNLGENMFIVTRGFRGFGLCLTGWKEGTAKQGKGSHIMAARKKGEKRKS